MATIPMQQQPTPLPPPDQAFPATPLKDLKLYTAPVDCPFCHKRGPTIVTTEKTPMSCGDVTKAVVGEISSPDAAFYTWACEHHPTSCATYPEPRTMILDVGGLLPTSFRDPAAIQAT
ncbi:hypothetical protein G7Y89_g3704 [Cudoniella acicularis]|uniref:Uncharacterized protein n=1 Tax=Cudoniella acicularis TaxID=354080 RepID=A0A8H4W4Y7_9HELO|nr:hypothetical protein G7Y89_g3704 [Cudoniella acicularis]